MENLWSTAKGLARSSAVREHAKNTLGHLKDVFIDGPDAILPFLEDLKPTALTVRDEIFLESLVTYILGIYQFDEDAQQFETENIRSLAAVLAEASPNPDADYTGDPEKLNEYAKRLIILLDDCGTKQKAVYLANLTRARIAQKINTKQFFQLSRCIRNLTEEDLSSLSRDIKEELIISDGDDDCYIDDYRSLGLLREVDGGFSYTKRAFELKNYALDYEHPVKMPPKFSPRLNPSEISAMSEEDVENIYNSLKEVKSDQQWKNF